mmetsp:Transcript_15016/g.49248  ORF Transcript_15016/g.49248 Transcript_15016/m.49248 type:complete len:415 (-) Transcript_15016:105-1349(-)
MKMVHEVTLVLEVQRLELQIGLDHCSLPFKQEEHFSPDVAVANDEHVLSVKFEVEFGDRHPQKALVAIRQNRRRFQHRRVHVHERFDVERLRELLEQEDAVEVVLGTQLLFKKLVDAIPDAGWEIELVRNGAHVRPLLPVLCVREVHVLDDERHLTNDGGVEADSEQQNRRRKYVLFGTQRVNPVAQQEQESLVDAFGVLLGRWHGQINRALVVAQQHQEPRACNPMSRDHYHHQQSDHLPRVTRHIPHRVPEEADDAHPTNRPEPRKVVVRDNTVRDGRKEIEPEPTLQVPPRNLFPVRHKISVCVLERQIKVEKDVKDEESVEQERQRLDDGMFAELGEGEGKRRQNELDEHNHRKKQAPKVARRRARQQCAVRCEPCRLLLRLIRLTAEEGAAPEVDALGVHVQPGRGEGQ